MHIKKKEWLQKKELSKKEEILRSPLIIVWVISLTPMSMLSGLYLASFRATQLIGHWPLPYRDDPLQIGENDLIYQFLVYPEYYDYSILILSLMFGIFLHFTFRSYNLLTILKIQFVIFIFGIWVLFGEPTQRVNWFLD